MVADSIATMDAPTLDIHTSNRLDVLVEHLANTLAAEPMPPLEREVIVVQSQGMTRWVSLQLADRLGIAASLKMPFPGPFCHQLADQLLGDDDDRPGSERLAEAAPSIFDRNLLTWRIFDHLPAAISLRSETTRSAPYLDDDSNQVKRYQLSSRLASLFEDYQLFRPEMMLAWERAGGAPNAAWGSEQEVQGISPEVGWQASLWRGLTQQLGTPGVDEQHLARKFTRLLDFLRHAKTAPPGLPHRLSVFGVSTLPPVFIDIAVATARFVPVRIYFTSPTYHYWGDLRSERETARIRRRLRASGRSTVDDHFEHGHSLLAGLGRQGREFFNLLQAADSEGTAWHELDFVDPGDNCLLHAIQSDILHLSDPESDDHPVRQLRAGDDSLSIHSCHSPRREMEVLRDQLLNAFEADPELRPADVLVMVPEIEDYSPYIEAVFGVEWEGSPRLPFSIADRQTSCERPLAETLLRVLDLATSRLLPGDVLDLLDTPAIRRRFDISAGEAPALRQWVSDAQIRWGMDGEQRQTDFAVPPEDANSWRAGLDRLIMGYAAGDPGEMVGGIAPFAGDTAGNTELLGRLIDFVDTLFKQLRELRESRPPEAWAVTLGTTLDDLYEADSEAEESALELLRETLEELTRAGEVGGLETPLNLAVIRAHLGKRLSTSGFASGFISGRITFCALKPMRSIPFKVIAIAGLKEGAFPRRDTRHSFDLVAQDPRPGDRSLREDDRYLFLETLLSATQRLILTYEGRSQKDNRLRAPSVIVSELLDVLERTFITEDGGSVTEALVVEHRLHPYSPDYYDTAGSPRLFSYVRDNYRASQSYHSPGSAIPFVTGVITSAVTSASTGVSTGITPPASPNHGSADVSPRLDIELQDLTEHWLNPSRYFCRKILQLHLDYGTRPQEDAEPFAVDFLSRYQLNQWLLARRLAATSESAELELLEGRGDLPLARLGKAHYEQLDHQVERFIAALPTFTPCDPIQIELRGDGWRLHGRLDNLTDIGALRFRCANLKPRDQLTAWIAHVALSAWATQHPTSLPTDTRVIGTDHGIRFRALPDAVTIIERLIAGYARGLEAPLPVFERASHAYIDQRRRLADPKSKARTPALEAARRAYVGDRFAGDLGNPYVALCFRDLEPLADADFATWAEQLWGPLLTHAEKIEP